MANVSGNVTFAYTPHFQIPDYWHVISSVILFFIIPQYLHLMVLAAQRQTLISPSLLQDRLLKEPWMYGYSQTELRNLSKNDEQEEVQVRMFEIVSKRAWVEVAKQRKPYAFWIAHATVWTNISMIGSNLTGFGYVPYALDSWPYHVSLFFADSVSCHFLLLVLTVQFSSLKLSKMNMKKSQNPDEYNRQQRNTRRVFHSAIVLVYLFYLGLYIHHVTRVRPKRIEVYEAFVTAIIPNIAFCQVLCVLEARRLLGFAFGIRKTFRQVGVASTHKPVSTKLEQSQNNNLEGAERKRPQLQRQGTKLAFKAVRRPLQVAFVSLILVSLLQYYLITMPIRQPSEFFAVAMILFIVGHFASVIGQLFYLRLRKQVSLNRQKLLKKKNRALQGSTIVSSAQTTTIVATFQRTERGGNQRITTHESKVKSSIIVT